MNQVPMPTLIRGVLYPSLGEAGRQLGVSPANISAALDRGTVDNMGLGRNFKSKKPVIVDGQKFESIGAAVRGTGLSVDQIRDGRNRAVAAGVPVRIGRAVVGVPT